MAAHGFGLGFSSVCYFVVGGNCGFCGLVVLGWFVCLVVFGFRIIVCIVFVLNLFYNGLFALLCVCYNRIYL